MHRDFLLVALGGAVGSAMRYGLSLLTAAWQWSPLWGTIGANVAGSFLIGVGMGACSGGWQLLMVVGLCGGFTTFSTFSAQSLGLMQEGRFGLAAAYILGSVAICLIATWLGSKLLYKL